MTKDDSRRTLKSIIPANSARLDGELDDLHTGATGTVDWRSHWSTVELQGTFSADQLEAIAVYMRDNFDPTRE